MLSKRNLSFKENFILTFESHDFGFYKNTFIEKKSRLFGRKINDLELFLYLETNNNSTPLSNISNTTDIENADDQRHHNTEIESLCRQITESAMSDNSKSSIFSFNRN